MQTKTLRHILQPRSADILAALMSRPVTPRGLTETRARAELRRRRKRERQARKAGRR